MVSLWDGPPPAVPGAARADVEARVEAARTRLGLGEAPDPAALERARALLAARG